MNNNNLSSRDYRNVKKDTLIVRLLSVACLVGGFQVATQYFAHQYEYQPQLGAHFFNIYEPWSILVWAVKWYDQYSGIFDLAAGFGILFSKRGFNFEVQRLAVIWCSAPSFRRIPQTGF